MGKHEIIDMALQLKAAERFEVAEKIMQSLDKPDAEIDRIDPAEAEHEYGVKPMAAKPEQGAYDAIVLAVAHPEFLQLGAQGIHALGKPNHVLYDVKALLGKKDTDGRL